jgi:two-component system LytT family response regulator
MSATGGLRVLVVDDEGPARQRLRDLLAQDAGIGLVHEASDGLAAIAALRRDAYDLVFLDVQMPECTGMEVVEQVGPAHMPLTVFVTAYDQHAIRAFENNAIDYLLKPYGDERFEAALNRARARLGERQSAALNEALLRVAATPAPPAHYLDRLVVKAGGVTRFVPITAIEWIESAGVYVTVHLGQRSFLHRASMKDMVAALDPRHFIRVHRSAIVNLDSVLQLEPVSHGEFDVVLKSGARTRISRSYRPDLETRLGQSL